MRPLRLNDVLVLFLWTAAGGVILGVAGGAVLGLSLGLMTFGAAAAWGLLYGALGGSVIGACAGLLGAALRRFPLCLLGGLGGGIAGALLFARFVATNLPAGWQLQVTENQLLCSGLAGGLLVGVLIGTVSEVSRPAEQHDDRAAATGQQRLAPTGSRLLLLGFVLVLLVVLALYQMLQMLSL